jgi:hypothetical protein
MTFAIICPLRGAGPEPEGSLPTHREIVLALGLAVPSKAEAPTPRPSMKAVADGHGHSPD